MHHVRGISDPSVALLHLCTQQQIALAPAVVLKIF